MKKSALCVLLCLILFAMPLYGFADFKKTKIAVLDFQLKGKGFESKDMGAMTAELFVTYLVKDGRFDVVERRLLTKIMAEHQLGESGMVDQTTATQIGKLLGVEAIISGTVIKLKNFTEINARIIRVETATIIAAESIRRSESGTFQDMVNSISAKIINNFPLEGYIVHKRNGIVSIDLGMHSGVKKGMHFIVFKEGNTIKHPKTGEVLDVERLQTGRLLITQVKNKISDAKVLEETEPNAIKYGQRVYSVSRELAVKKQPGAGSGTTDKLSKVQSQAKKSPATTAKGVSAKKKESLPQSKKAAKKKDTSSQSRKKARSRQASGKYQIGVLPLTMRLDADMIKDRLETEIRRAVKKAIDRFESNNRPVATFLKAPVLKPASRWRAFKPDNSTVFGLGKKQGFDGVLLYHVAFNAGQGLVNGWGTDIRNPDFRVYLFDIKKKRVYLEKDTTTNSVDQAGIQLQTLSDKLIRRHARSK